MIAPFLASNAGAAFVIMLALLILVYFGVACAAWTITGSPKPRRSWKRSWHWRARKVRIAQSPNQPVAPSNRHDRITSRFTYPRTLK